MSAPVNRRFLLTIPAVATAELLLMIRNVVVLPESVRDILVPLQALLIVCLIALWLYLRTHPRTPDQFRRYVLVFIAAMVALLLLEMSLTGDGLLAANLALMPVVAGSLVFTTRYLLAFLGLVVAAWLLVVVLREPWALPLSKQLPLVLLGVLISVLVHALRFTDRSALEQARDDAVRSAMRDELTGLWNRRGVAAVLPALIGGAHTAKAGVWCLFIDVRGLKRLNDSKGHAAGDALLAATGRVLLAREAAGEVAARWGGDEFCVFGAGPPPDAASTARLLTEKVRQRLDGSQDWALSCGVSSSSDASAAVVADLVAQADADMYRRRDNVSS